MPKLTPHDLAMALCRAALNYSPADDDEPETVLHDLVIVILDGYGDAVEDANRPQDKHLPALFRALDEATGPR